jgi:hypothetical protein
MAAGITIHDMGAWTEAILAGIVLIVLYCILYCPTVYCITIRDIADTRWYGRAFVHGMECKDTFPVAPTRDDDDDICNHRL